MLRTMFKSKIHRAIVTDADLHYEGSITIDINLLEAAGIYEYEKVDIYNITNGARFSTYTINGERNSGEICLNGAAARHVQVGDMVIIAAYVQCEENEIKDLQQFVVQVDENNTILNKNEVLV